MKPINFKNIAPREKLALIAVAAFLLVTAAWLLVYEPLVERQEILRAKIESKRGEIAESAALADKIMELKKNFTRFDTAIKNKPKGFSILSEVESLSESAGLRGAISSMTPQPASVVEGYRESILEVTMKNVSLGKLVRLMESLRESQGGVWIKRISVKPDYKDPSSLAVSMTLAAYDIAQ